jgi:hypothetical protein
LGGELQRMNHGPTPVGSARLRFIDGCTTAGRGDGSWSREKVATIVLGGAKVASPERTKSRLARLLLQGLI